MINVSFDIGELVDLKYLVEVAIFNQKTRRDKMRKLEESDGYEKGSLTEYFEQQIEEYSKLREKLHNALCSDK